VERSHARNDVLRLRLDDHGRCPYGLVASGVSGTSWTSGALTSGTNYWFEVVAVVGSNWAGVTSSASAESSINSTNPFCVQP